MLTFYKKLGWRLRNVLGQDLGQDILNLMFPINLHFPRLVFCNGCTLHTKLSFSQMLLEPPYHLLTALIQQEFGILFGEPTLTTNILYFYSANGCIQRVLNHFLQSEINHAG